MLVHLYNPVSAVEFDFVVWENWFALFVNNGNAIKKAPQIDMAMVGKSGRVFDAVIASSNGVCGLVDTFFFGNQSCGLKEVFSIARTLIP